MKIRIVCIGKLKEGFYRDAVKEFTKRLSRYSTVEIVELPDEKAGENLSDAQKKQVRYREGRRILGCLSPSEYLIASDIGGVRFSSEAFAKQLDRIMSGGGSCIAIAVGGSLGLSREVMDRANLCVSFSDMTFTHQLFRVMLLEQVYRAFKIINGEPYHK
ncbi:MAG: 23S rRNA (pseudouridine(1915)-N(3))-methyltransferase RlmH [Christensenellales bacterium]|jgi:23S rRNA (pseudouridine1915-N3)-methyltransferase|nr:23S rRNA (pseudouridine(1915)-N(3))-methyltransferase RlmH [Christensenellales bacterium]